MIEREKQIDRLRKLRDTNLINVVIGIRRAGKSTLFRQFQQELFAVGVKEKQIIYLNLEEMENEALLNRFVLNDSL